MGTTFLGYFPDNFKAPYDKESNKFVPNTLDLMFHQGEKYKIKKSMCSAGEYEVSEKGKPSLLSFFGKIRSPEKRQFSSDHALLMGDFKFIK